MATDSLLLHIDQIVIDGKAVEFEDGSCMISGTHRYENKVIVAASGNDAASRNRVPTTLKLRLLLKNPADIPAITAAKDTLIAARDTQKGVRAICKSCIFLSLGELGSGAVDITYGVLAPIQWL
jgi:hypothetical protein